MRAARNATPARSFIDQGWGDQAGDLDRVALADSLRRLAGDLDGEDLGLALAQRDQLHDIQRLAVLIRPWLLGVERQDRLWLQGAQGSPTCPLGASCSPSF